MAAFESSTAMGTPDHGLSSILNNIDHEPVIKPRGARTQTQEVQQSGTILARAARSDPTGHSLGQLNPWTFGSELHAAHAAPHAAVHATRTSLPARVHDTGGFVHANMLHALGMLPSRAQIVLVDAPRPLVRMNARNLSHAGIGNSELDEAADLAAGLAPAAGLGDGSALSRRSSNGIDDVDGSQPAFRRVSGIAPSPARVSIASSGSTSRAYAAGAAHRQSPQQQDQLQQQPRGPVTRSSTTGRRRSWLAANDAVPAMQLLAHMAIAAPSTPRAASGTIIAAQHQDQHQQHRLSAAGRPSAAGTSRLHHTGRADSSFMLDSAFHHHNPQQDDDVADEAEAGLAHLQEPAVQARPQPFHLYRDAMPDVSVLAIATMGSRDPSAAQQLISGQRHVLSISGTSSQPAAVAAAGGAGASASAPSGSPSTSGAATARTLAAGSMAPMLQGPADAAPAYTRPLYTDHYSSGHRRGSTHEVTADAVGADGGVGALAAAIAGVLPEDGTGMAPPRSTWLAVRDAMPDMVLLASVGVPPQQTPQQPQLLTQRKSMDRGSAAGSSIIRSSSAVEAFTGWVDDVAPASHHHTPRHHTGGPPSMGGSELSTCTSNPTFDFHGYVGASWGVPLDPSGDADREGQKDRGRELWASPSMNVRGRMRTSLSGSRTPQGPGSDGRSPQQGGPQQGRPHHRHKRGEKLLKAGKSLLSWIIGSVQPPKLRRTQSNEAAGRHGQQQAAAAAAAHHHERSSGSYTTGSPASGSAAIGAGGGHRQRLPALHVQSRPGSTNSSSQLILSPHHLRDGSAHSALSVGLSAHSSGLTPPASFTRRQMSVLNRSKVVGWVGPGPGEVLNPLPPRFSDAGSSYAPGLYVSGSAAGSARTSAQEQHQQRQRQHQQLQGERSGGGSPAAAGGSTPGGGSAAPSPASTANIYRRPFPLPPLQLSSDPAQLSPIGSPKIASPISPNPPISPNQPISPYPPISGGNSPAGGPLPWERAQLPAAGQPSPGGAGVAAGSSRLAASWRSAGGSSILDSAVAGGAGAPPERTSAGAASPAAAAAPMPLMQQQQQQVLLGPPAAGATPLGPRRAQQRLLRMFSRDAWQDSKSPRVSVAPPAAAPAASSPSLGNRSSGGSSAPAAPASAAHNHQHSAPASTAALLSASPPGSAAGASLDPAAQPLLSPTPPPMAPLPPLSGSAEILRRRATRHTAHSPSPSTPHGASPMGSPSAPSSSLHLLPASPSGSAQLLPAPPASTAHLPTSPAHSLHLHLLPPSLSATVHPLPTSPSSTAHLPVPYTAAGGAAAAAAAAGGVPRLPLGRRRSSFSNG